jgi:hypothetical protein
MTCSASLVPSWPPPLIFDVAGYGCAALKTWGEDLFVNFAEEHVRDIYYNLQP